MPSLTLRLVLAGSVLVATCTGLALTLARLGSPLFFAFVTVMGVCQITALIATRHAPPTRRLLLLAFLFAAACRVPLTLAPVNFDSDMIRYIWDGRVQRLGYNPYALVPSDPALAHTHDADTARMPSRHVRTPYPPAAQLFFRLVVTISESRLFMKTLFTLCDLVTLLLVWRWLAVTGRNEWLALVYAWNPLVILEVALSSHLDALGAMFIVAAAFLLSRRRTTLASLAFTLAVATKLLPIVLAPLFLNRVRPRDIALGVGLLAALYLPFMFGASLPVGAVPSVIAQIRFNSPIFRPLAWVITPGGAALVALLAGFTAAVWARLRLDADNPAAWAWPMALALACAPVVYPWYLLYFTPFLFTRATAPLAVWTYAVIPVYVVWERALSGAAWRVPLSLMVVEYGLVLTAIAVVALWRTSRTPSRDSTLATTATTTG